MSPDDLRQDLELKIVEYIKTKLAEGTMTEERSQQVSQMVLDTLQPGMSMEALYRAIFRLDDACTELSPIVIPYARDYETNVTQKAAELVKKYIRTGQYDAAVKLAKDAITENVKISWQGTGTP
jgi:hypothetical protein